MRELDGTHEVATSDASGTGRAPGDRVPVPPLARCGALGKLCNFSVLSFSHL